MEVRRKTIGIIGYGHIGPQVGLLAEALGMKVVFHDILKKLPLGNARQVSGLEELLKMSDFVTLHVPDTPLTRGMIGREQLQMMPQGSYLLNLSRGSVVDIGALRDALVSGHLAGAALDVFPKEPSSGKDPFDSELRGLDNVILTPHIGGSTEEAQRNIGMEVSDALIAYAQTGSSIGCANLPEVQLPAHRGQLSHAQYPQGYARRAQPDQRTDCGHEREHQGAVLQHAQRHRLSDHGCGAKPFPQQWKSRSKRSTATSAPACCSSWRFFP